MAIDEGNPVHYAAVQRGTAVFSRDEVEIGKVDTVIDNYREHIFDGLVIELSGGDLRFVDAPEVARTAERAVLLTVASSEVQELPPPEKGAPHYRPRRGGRLSRLLGGGWRRG